MYFFTGAVVGPWRRRQRAQGRGLPRPASDRPSAIAVTVARDGRWTDLTLVGTGEVGGERHAPRRTRAGRRGARRARPPPRRWVAEAHLDLSDARASPPREAVVAGLKYPLHPGRSRPPPAASSRRIDERAVIDARTYEIDRTTAGLDVAFGDGVGVGFGKYDDATERARLIAATTRGRDGQWQCRDECLKEETHMTTTATTAFAGFPREGFEFLADLADRQHEGVLRRASRDLRAGAARTGEGLRRRAGRAAAGPRLAGHPRRAARQRLDPAHHARYALHDRQAALQGPSRHLVLGGAMRRAASARGCRCACDRRPSS